MSATDRTPKPCTHPHANHQHGTYAAYKRDGCRCVEYAAETARRSKAQRYRHANGTGPLVDTQRACERLAVTLDAVRYRAARDDRQDVLDALTRAAAA